MRGGRRTDWRFGRYLVRQNERGKQKDQLGVRRRGKVKIMMMMTRRRRKERKVE